MKKMQMIALLAALVAMTGLPINKAEALTYVTDTGGCAYDECRAATNLAPALALGTVIAVGIIAVAVQNSHGHHSHNSSSSCCSSSSCHSSSSSDCCSSSSSGSYSSGSYSSSY